MFKTAFSTVACPDWLLAQVASAAARWGYDGVELRTFGTGSSEFACDPALTDSAKVRAIFSHFGMEAAVLATGVSFDAPVLPPVIGWAITDTEKTIRAAKSAIDLAAQIEAPFVRVFGFQVGNEKRGRAVKRIAERLRLACDGARHSGVRLVIENGGSFETAAEIADIIDAVGNPLLGASYSAAVAGAAGEDPVEGAALLGDRLWVARVRDRLPNGRPCLIGDGEMGIPRFVENLHARGYGGWVVVEWDRAWLPGLEPADAVLPEAVRRLHAWAKAPGTRRGASAAVVSM